MFGYRSHNGFLGGVHNFKTLLNGIKLFPTLLISGANSVYNSINVISYQFNIAEATKFILSLGFKTENVKWITNHINLCIPLAQFMMFANEKTDDIKDFYIALNAAIVEDRFSYDNFTFEKFSNSSTLKTAIKDPTKIICNTATAYFFVFDEVIAPTCNFLSAAASSVVSKSLAGESINFIEVTNEGFIEAGSKMISSKLKKEAIKLDSGYVFAEAIYRVSLYNIKKKIYEIGSYMTIERDEKIIAYIIPLDSFHKHLQTSEERSHRRRL